MDNSIYTHYLDIYITTLNIIFSMLKDGKNIAILTDREKILNIKPKNFRLLISKIVASEDPNLVLRHFRKYKFIICDDTKRSFTCVRKINGKNTRMISVDRKFAEALLEDHTQNYSNSM